MFGYFFIALLLNVISFSFSFMNLSLSHDLGPESGGLTQVDLGFFCCFFKIDFSFYFYSSIIDWLRTNIFNFYK
jgi:hypothetical protein